MWSSSLEIDRIYSYSPDLPHSYFHYSILTLSQTFPNSAIQPLPLIYT